MAAEGLTLDGFNLNDETVFVLERFDNKPARKKKVRAGGADSDGDVPVDETRYEQAIKTVRIRIAQQADMDTALAKVAQLTDKLQKTEVVDGGLALVWTPAGATKSTTYYVVSGEIVERPIEVEGEDAGWLVRAPVVVCELECRPFGYGTQYTGPTKTSAEPIQSLEIPDVPGDVDAELTLVVTDMATQQRKTVEVGLEQRHYDPGAPFDVILEGADLSITGTQSTSSGAESDAFNTSCYRLRPLLPAWQPVAKATGLTHRGRLRVKARVKNTCDEETAYARLLYRIGGTAYLALPAVAVPPLLPAAYVEIDLGVIDVPAGTANLDLQLQASSDAISTSSEGLHLDYLTMVPAQRYALAVSETVQVGGSALNGYDDFFHDKGVILGNTNIPAPAPAAWDEGGDVDDWIIGAIGGYVRRDVSSPDASADAGQIVFHGSAITNTTVAVDVLVDNASKTTDEEVQVGAVARYVDASNYLKCVARIKRRSGKKYLQRIALYKIVAGTVTKLGEIEATETSAFVGGIFGGGGGGGGGGASSMSGGLQLTVDTTGKATVSTGSLEDGRFIQDFEVTDAVLATGGALDDGKTGIYGSDTTTSEGFAEIYRYMSLAAAAPAQDTTVIPSGGKVTLSADAAESNNAAGTAPARVNRYRGARLYVPPKGELGKTARITVKSRRTNIVDDVDTGIADSTKIETFIRPRYVNAPR